MSQSLDLLKNITSFLFLVQNTSPSLYTNEKCKSNLNNNSSKVYLLFFSDSAINKIVLYFGQCIAICGPEFQRTSVITYSSFCLVFSKNEGKRRFVMALKIVIGLCYFSPLPWTQLKWVSSLCFLDNFRPQIVHL